MPRLEERFCSHIVKLELVACREQSEVKNKKTGLLDQGMIAEARGIFRISTS